MKTLSFRDGLNDEIVILSELKVLNMTQKAKTSPFFILKEKIKEKFSIKLLAITLLFIAIILAVPLFISFCLTYAINAIKSHIESVLNDQSEESEDVF